MASYTDGFKMNVVSHLKDLKELGIITVVDQEIKNVRQLCEFFDISTQSLYRWQKTFSHLKSKKNDVSDDNSEIEYQDGDENSDEYLDYNEKTYEMDGIDSQESESEFADFSIENSEMKRDFFEPVQAIKKPKKKSKRTGEKEIFNQRYYGWFAGMLGIKGYSNMLVPQLKLTIGNELIRQSGLIDMNKASAKLKKNGINK